MLPTDFIHRFTEIAKGPDPDLAPAALFIARLEYPHLDARQYLDRLDEMGENVSKRLSLLDSDPAPAEQIDAISSYLFKDEGFTGNTEAYDDPRNSFLNQVIERRTGIPITLALVYIEVARRAGVRVDGVNFPGHFLLRLTKASPHTDDHIIIDPFHGGNVLSEMDCQKLMRKHSRENSEFDGRLLVRATKQQILLRMLVNLKTIYVRMRSFPQAFTLTELLLALDPSAMTELRDRGLLAYHLNYFSSALRDLETYLHFTSRSDKGRTDETLETGKVTEQEENAEIWEHIKELRRRVASLN